MREARYCVICAARLRLGFRPTCCIGPVVR